MPLPGTGILYLFTNCYLHQAGGVPWFDYFAGFDGASARVPHRDYHEYIGALAAQRELCDLVPFFP